ncbi:hypothetical protein B0I35DRAFT_199223 [Stachybotrys elegans]|uniref:Uncharacterized protein n=1 Tax=Stachybotrys elegans TaxID=80388 RepID=A0A8K0STP4_9HYPO|nr:hypothetical protein B0I35DRAFT_199223 [Stachybotrys elegans]
MRVIWLWTWDLTDLTYTVVPGAIWSCLEPTLGVVNACLPTMMPAIHKLFGPGAFGFTRRGTSNGISGKSSSGLASHSHERRTTISGKENTHRDFERLDDEYPLTSIQADTSSTNKSIEDGRGGQGITVTRQWDFDTQPRV